MFDRVELLMDRCRDTYLSPSVGLTVALFGCPQEFHPPLRPRVPRLAFNLFFLSANFGVLEFWHFGILAFWQFRFGTASAGAILADPKGKWRFDRN